MMQFPAPGTFQNGLAGPMLSAMLYGGKCIQYSKLTVDDTVKSFAEAVKATFGVDGLPAEAMTCIIVVEADATQADAARVVRFRQDSQAPTATEGMPVGDNGSFEIKGDNLANFKVIGITPAKSHTLRIEFYGAG